MFEHLGIEAKDENSKLLAAAAYLPISPINVLAILYVLFAKKDDKYARFHAIQSGLLLVGLFVVIFALVLLSFVLSLAAGSIGGIFSLLPMCIVPVFFLAELYFTYLAYKGVAFSLPVVSGFAQSHA